MTMINKWMCQRYGHWTSAMRAEMLDRILELEKQIETKHFEGRVSVCATCGLTYSKQGECPVCFETT